MLPCSLKSPTDHLYLSSSRMELPIWMASRDIVHGAGTHTPPTPYSSIAHAFRIFIIEGLIGVVAALFGWWLIADWPPQAKFLSEEEKQLLARRLASDTSDAQTSHLDGRALRRIFKDWKIYAGSCR